MIDAKEICYKTCFYVFAHKFLLCAVFEFGDLLICVNEEIICEFSIDYEN